MEAVIVIPARYSSSRFPGKPMQKVLGISMLERVWRIANSTRHAVQVLIATEDQRIVEFATTFHGRAVLTSESCTNGTERVAEAIEIAGLRPDIIVNLQGDALLTPPWVLDAMIDDLIVEPEAEMVTPAVPLEGAALEIFATHKRQHPASGTSVVFDQRQRALYFSKAILPFSRDARNVTIFRHVGLYGFRRSALARYVALSPSRLELMEGLEQLRALDHGMVVRVALVDYRGRTHGSIDSPGDVAVVEEVIRREGELVSERYDKCW